MKALTKFNTFIWARIATADLNFVWQQEMEGWSRGLELEELELELELPYLSKVIIMFHVVILIYVPQNRDLNRQSSKGLGRALREIVITFLGRKNKVHYFLLFNQVFALDPFKKSESKDSNSFKKILWL